MKQLDKTLIEPAADAPDGLGGNHKQNSEKRHKENGTMMPDVEHEPRHVDGEAKKSRAGKGQKRGSRIRNAIKELQASLVDEQLKTGQDEADKDACRGKFGIIFPYFEKIIEEHPITQEGNNAALFNRVLNLRLKVKAQTKGSNGEGFSGMVRGVGSPHGGVG